MGPYRQILCPTDGGATSQLGVQEAVKVAKAMGAGLHFFHVIDFQPAMFEAEGITVAPDMLESLKVAAREVMDRAQQVAAAHQVEATVGAVEIVGTRVSEAILEEAKRRGADLIVLGTHGRSGVQRLLHGSEAEAVARESPCAVLIVREHG